MKRLASGRLYLYGYRMNEVDPISIPPSKEDLKIGESNVTSMVYNSFRTILSTSLPVCFVGATPPRPDPGHVPSLVGGVLKRFGFDPPKRSRRVRRHFRRFVMKWLIENLEPLTDADIPTFEEWLESTPYTSARKCELAREWEKYQKDPSSVRLEKIKSFIKDETYPEYKYPRLINSRIDAAKCVFGPIVQAVSDKLFALPWFIKKIPVPERPIAIRNALLTSSLEDYKFTDYTAYEAHFTAEVMEDTQVLLFQHMLRNTFQGSWLELYTSTMTGRNLISFKDVSVMLSATRMSGEMDTSLSNGFANLMLFLYAANKKGATHVVGYVEGDDGLFRVSPPHCAPTKEDFEELGFTIKIGETDALSEASFCGQVYHMDDLIVVTDIKEVLSRVGWTNKKYVRAKTSTLMQLLRAKGYSLVYQYNGCPILDVLGRRLLELTEGVNISETIFQNMDQWEAAKLRAATTGELPLPKIPGDGTRELVERLYGVPVKQQLELEQTYKTIELGLHENPFTRDCPPDWVSYFDQYSLNYPARDPCWLNKPEEKYLDLLGSYPAASKFVASLKRGMLR